MAMPPYLSAQQDPSFRASGAGAFRPVAPSSLQMVPAFPPSWPLGIHPAPVPPFQPLMPATHRQAAFTTYPSRVKAGTTTLSFPSGEEGSASAAYGSRGLPDADLSRGSAARSSRRATRVVYREASDEEELHAEDNVESDHGDAESSDDAERPGIWLGRPLPANRTMVHEARPWPYPRWTAEQLASTSSQAEVLLPIKIELEVDDHLIRDLFTWNKSERLLTPMSFAQRFLYDLDLPLEPHAEVIAASIQRQIEEADTADLAIGPAPGSPWAAPSMTKSQEHAARAANRRRNARPWDWCLYRDSWEPARKRRRTVSAPSLDGRTEGLMSDQLAEINGGVKAEAEDDLRVMLSYEVQILRDVLRDRVEWDLCSPLTAEDFAESLCRDLGLTGEAIPLIANSVRVELAQHKRAVVEQGLLGSGAQYEEARREFEEAQLEERQERIEWAAAQKRAELFGLPAPQPAVSDPASQQGATPTPAPSAVDSPAPAPLVPEKRGRGRPPRHSRLSVTEGDLIGTGGTGLTLPAMRRRKEAEAALASILNRSSKPLQNIWRDWFEAKETGPTLERLSPEDLERLAQEQLRTARRGKREQARAAPGRRRR